VVAQIEGQEDEEGASLDICNSFCSSFFTFLFSLLVSQPEVKSEQASLTLTQEAS
jgi:hypothetical protein